MEPSTKPAKIDNNEDSDGFSHFATEAIHAGQEPEQWKSNALVPLISLSTTFKQLGPAQLVEGFEYTRGGNPTRQAYEKCLAACEGAEYALAFSSGLATSMTIVHLLNTGDHIVCCDDVYGGTNRYFRKVVARMGIETAFVDCSNPENVRQALTKKTKLVWLESPTNPLLKLVDIKAVSAIVRSYSESQNEKILIVVDNTFMSAYFQRPLALGADITMHSITKYMNGHGDVLGGCVCLNDKDLRDRLYFLQYAIGAVQSPFDCYMANRGLKTLAVRMKQHQQNAMACAQFLENHPCVERVVYPGLPSHPQHELAKCQAKGFSGMVTIFIKGGISESEAFFKNTKIFTLAESLGGFESLAELPARMTHASVSPEQRAELGITDTLIRLSVGLEEADDLIADLDQALQAAVPEKLR